MPVTTRSENKAAAAPSAAAADPFSPDLPWPDFATPAILAPLTGEERKPLRAACRAGRDAVDAGITRLELKELSNWGSGQGAAPWTGVSLDFVRLPALRHLNLGLFRSSSPWEQHGAAHMRGAARLMAAHAPALHTLRLSLWISLQPESHRELAALEGGFLESVLLAAPLPALQRLDLGVGFGPAGEARCLEALRPLARLYLPRLARLSLDADYATAQGVRWLERAHLPALRHLAVLDYSTFRPDHYCSVALSAPRWSALEALDLFGDPSSSGDMAALSAALAPTLRRLVVVRSWPLFCTKGCAEEWPQLRSLDIFAHGDSSLAEQLGPVRLPRLERVAVCEGEALRGFAARRAALPVSALWSAAPVLKL